MIYVLDYMKGKSTIGELMQLPNRIFHTLYHNHYLVEEERKRREKNKPAESKPSSTNISKENMKEFEEELEDIGWEGLI